MTLQALFRQEIRNPAARATLFSELAERFRSRVPFPEDLTAGLSEEQYVRNVAEVLTTVGRIHEP